MKTLLTAGLAAAAVAFAAPAFAQDAHAGHAAPAAAKLSAADTPIADIAAVPEGKAALDKNLPGLTTHEAYEQFKGMSLKQVQPLSAGAITDEAIAALQADLDNLAK
jgi:parvulin-like peptidyl-prolyl isomerase